MSVPTSKLDDDRADCYLCWLTRNYLETQQVKDAAEADMTDPCNFHADMEREHENYWEDRDEV